MFRIRSLKKPIFIILATVFIASVWLMNGGYIERKLKFDPQTETDYPVWIIVDQDDVTPQQLRNLTPCEMCKVLVIARENTLFQFNLSENVEYLNVSRLGDSGHRIARHLSRITEVSKMLSCLYAIQHGALHIYDWNGDKRAFLTPAAAIDFQLREKLTSGLVYDDTSALVVNPFPHFGGSAIVPAEFRSIPANSSYFLRFLPRSVIQHRLTEHGLDFQAPPFFLLPGAMVSLGTQNTLHSYPAFWALFFPSTLLPGSWLWKGFCTQKLLWMTGHTAGLLPPMTPLNRIPVENEISEGGSYWKTGVDIVKFLRKWTCDRRSRFFTCVIALTAEMTARGYFRPEDQLLVVDWLSDLRDVGYAQPSRAKWKAETLGRNWVYYRNAGHGSTSSPIGIFDDFLLVVVFPGEFSGEYRVLKRKYRMYFNKILFCSSISGYRKLRSVLGAEDDVSFVNASGSSNVRGYECAVRAIEMRYAVKGYVVVESEARLSPQNLANFDFNYSRIFEATEINAENFRSSKEDVRLAFADIGTVVPDPSNEEHMRILKKFWQRCFATNTSCVTSARFGAFFIAKADAHVLSLVLRAFLKHNVSEAIAMPTALAGLHLMSNS